MMNAGTRVAYRCCPHCKDDTVHAVETDDHDIPCNAPNSSDCVGRWPAVVAADPAEWSCRDCGATGSLSDSVTHRCVVASVAADPADTTR